MSITNLTATNVNGIQDISTAQNITAGVNATAVDEVLNIRAGISTGNTTGTVVFTNCAIKAFDGSWLDYGGGNLGVNSTISLIDSYVEWNIAGGRQNMKVSRLIGTHIRSTNSGGPAFLYTQAGNKAVIDARDGKPTLIDGIYVHEIAGAPLTYRNAVYKNCALNILNWEAGDLPIRNISYGSGTRTGANYTGADGQTYNTYDAWLGPGNPSNRFRFYDCTINLSKIACQFGSVGQELNFKYFSRSEKYFAGASVLSGLNIQYSPTASSGSSSQAAFFVTTNSSGVTSTAKIDLLVQNTVDDGTARNSGLSDVQTVRNYTLKNITWNRKVRGYGYQSTDGDATPLGQVGNTGAEANVYMLPRTMQPSLSQSAAAVLTGIAMSPSGANSGTMTVTEPRTGAQLWAWYNNWIFQQGNFGSSDTWNFDGKILNTGAWNVVCNSTITGSVTTTGTITGTGSITGTAIDANSVGVINVLLTSLTDTVEMRKASDNSLIATRTGAGSFAVSPSNVGVSVYFERRASANLVMSTITTPVTLTAGVNEPVPLYAGAEVQVAQAGRIDLLPTLSEMTSGGIAQQSTLTALASTNQTEHDATQAAIAALPAGVTVAQIRADIERTGGMLDAVPTLPEMLASTLAKQADLTGLATATNVTNAQTAIVGEINAVKADTAAINAKTATLINAPTKEQIRAELETAGSKLDKAMKAAQSAEDQTV